VPAYFRKWLKEAPPNTLFYFPWGDETIVDRRFWECIVGTGAWSSGWLRDEVRINFCIVLLPNSVEINKNVFIWHILPYVSLAYLRENTNGVISYFSVALC
jgi:hypothetical protein